MNPPIYHIGGARIGRMNATWPFATLTCSREELVIRVFILGTYTFRAHNIVKIEAYTSIPVIGRGIKITHKLSTYPNWIVFWCFGTPQSILREIEAIGFKPPTLD